MILIQRKYSLPNPHDCSRSRCRIFIQFVKSGEYAAESFQTPDFISFFTQLLVVFPRFRAAAFWRHDRREPQFRDQFSRLISFTGPVHDHRARFRSRSQLHQQPAAFRGIPGLSRRKRENHRASGGSGNQMKFCCPSAAGFADRLRAIFFLMPRFRQDELS